MPKCKPKSRKVHPQHRMHPHSIKSFHEIRKQRKVQGYKALILVMLEDATLSRQEMAKKIGCDTSSLCRAVYELRDEGKINEAYSDKNPRTGITVDYFKLSGHKGKEPRQTKLL